MFLGVCVSVYVSVVCVSMLRWVSTFVILSPTDYQTILAELQSPAALRSDPHFLVPELPITPNPSLAHHHHYTEPDTLANSHPPRPPWSPEVDPGSTEPGSSPRSPPRRCELALTIPTFELPDPVPSKVRKPHIALNDQLLLSEDEDRSCQEKKASPKPKSHSIPTICELDIDVAYSTSSPSASSLSITPSTPDRVQVENGGGQVGASSGVQVNLKECEKEGTDITRKAVEVIAAGRDELVGKWVEQDLIKNVERKCEMVTKDSLMLAESKNNWMEQMPTSTEEGEVTIKEPRQEWSTGPEEEVRDVEEHSEPHNLIELVPEEKHVREGFSDISVDGANEGSVADRTGDRGGELQCKDEDGVSCINFTSCQATEKQDAADLLPQTWVEALGECRVYESGSSEEEEEADNEIPNEALRSPLGEVKTKEGSEEKEEDKETTEARVQESFNQAKKDMCSLPGWHSDSSSVNVEPPTPGRSVSSDLLDRRER